MTYHRYSDDAGTKLKLLTRVADTYFQYIGDHERGFVALCEAFRELPSDTAVWLRPASAKIETM